VNQDTAPRFADFGPFRLDLRTNRLLSEGLPLQVPPKAVETLKVLVERHGEVVEKDELLRLVWPDAVVEESNLSQQIFTLRRLFRDDPERPRFIATVPRRGYRFVADVKTGDGAPPASPAPPVAAPADGAPESLHRSGRFPRLLAWRRHAAWAVALLVTIMLQWLIARYLASEPTGMAVQFELGWPPGTVGMTTVGSPAVAPDGRTIAIVATRAGGASQIWLRRLDRAVVEPLRGSDGALSAFWSPDATQIAFFASGKLFILPSLGGVPRELCDAIDPRGGTWGVDGSIVFAPDSRSPLYRIAAVGGPLRALTSLHAARRDVSHRWPQFLPGTDRLLFQVWSGDTTTQGVFVVSVRGGSERRVLADASPAALIGGDLLLNRRESLIAVPFDASSARVTGEPTVIASPVPRYPNDDSPFSAAGGTIVFARGRFESRLVWLDAGGRQFEIGRPGQYGDPSISPDGHRVAYQWRDRANGNENMDIWVADAARGTRTRVTFDPSVDVLPVWSPDGRQLAFRSNRSGTSDLYRKSIDADVPETRLLASELRKDPTDWSPDGRAILFTQFNSRTDADIWQVAADGSAPPHVVIAGPGVQWGGRFSPDGRYVAYVSNESGRFDVIVQSLGPDRRRWLISVAGGSEPSWRHDGQQLLYVGLNDELMRVEVKRAGEAVVFGAPERVMPLPPIAGGLRNGVAVSPDGHHVAVVTRDPVTEPPPLTVSVNWRRSRN
jgi:eukaryotic-like serine/threonine-protein kinase